MQTEIPYLDPRPIDVRLAEIGITVSQNQNGVGKRELFLNGESIGFYWPLEAIEKFLK